MPATALPTLTPPPFSSSSFFQDHPDNEVVEFTVLLPEWQLQSLEQAARERGMTIGQLIRRVFASEFPRSE